MADDAVLIDAATRPGVPDEFQRLWNPHRMAYIDAGPSRGATTARSARPRMSDEDALIVARGEHAYVLLNLFPYNNGSPAGLPVPPHPLYDEATDEEVAEIGELTQTAMRVLRAVSHCDGFNIGMNQGRSRGPGSPGTCTSTSCRGGSPTRTSSRSSRGPSRCPSCSATPAGHRRRLEGLGIDETTGTAD